MRTTPQHRLRKSLALGAAAALTLSLAACGGGGDDNDSADSDSATIPEGEFLTITTFGEFGYDDLIKEWNAADHDFDVKQRKIANWDDWKQELTSKLQAGSGLPDIAAVEGDYMPAILGVSDQFRDLSDDADADRWVDYKAAEATNGDGQLMGFPTDAGPEAICYRGDLLKKAGLANNREEAAALFEDWDTYFATGEKFVKKLPDTAWYDASGSIAQAMLNQVEFPFQTEDNTIDVENDDLREVYDTVASYSDSLSTQAVQWSEDWTKNFTNDGFATMPCPGWMFANIKANAPDVKGWDIADAFPGGGGNWGGSFLTVPEQSKYQDQAAEFAAWVTDKDQELAAFEAAGAYPSNEEAQQDPALTETTDEYFNNAPTGEILANRAAAVPPGVPYKGDKYSDILAAFQSGIQRVDEGTDPEESWETFLNDVAQLG